MRNDEIQAMLETQNRRIPRPSPVQPVRVVDVDIPFSSMVMLLVKLSLASIPAMLILGPIAVGIVVAALAVLAALS